MLKKSIYILCLLCITGGASAQTTQKMTHVIADSCTDFFSKQKKTVIAVERLGNKVTTTCTPGSVTSMVYCLSQAGKRTCVTLKPGENNYSKVFSALERAWRVKNQKIVTPVRTSTRQSEVRRSPTVISIQNNTTTHIRNTNTYTWYEELWYGTPAKSEPQKTTGRVKQDTSVHSDKNTSTHEKTSTNMSDEEHKKGLEEISDLLPKQTMPGASVYDKSNPDLPLARESWRDPNTKGSDNVEDKREYFTPDWLLPEAEMRKVYSDESVGMLKGTCEETGYDSTQCQCVFKVKVRCTRLKDEYKNPVQF